MNGKRFSTDEKVRILRGGQNISCIPNCENILGT
jgi:hypothetical protein